MLRQPEKVLYQAAPDGLLNVGVGRDLAINDLVDLIQQVVGTKLTVRNDTSKPDGTPRKLVDVSRMHRLGWKAPTSLKDGIRRTYAWMQQQESL